MTGVYVKSGKCAVKTNNKYNEASDKEEEERERNRPGLGR